MLVFAFFIMAILHFGGFVTLPLLLVFSPLILLVVILLAYVGIAWRITS